MLGALDLKNVDGIPCSLQAAYRGSTKSHSRISRDVAGKQVGVRPLRSKKQTLRSARWQRAYARVVVGC
jgi:hypothetical protein